MIRSLLFTLFSFILSLATFGQTTNELMKMGDAAMVNGQYTNAIYYYSFILHKVKRNDENIYYAYEITTTYKVPEKTASGEIVPPASPSSKEIILIHKLAEAYLRADDYSNAKIWYESAVQHPLEDDKQVRYNYGLALMYNEEFEKAQQQFIVFQTELDEPESENYRLAESQIASCQFALNPINTNSDIETILVDSIINIGSTSLGLQFTSANYMIFSSARDDAETISSEENNDRYLLDLYHIKTDSNGKFGTPEKFPTVINSIAYHEGSAVLSPDGNTLYFTRMDPSNRNETKIYSIKKQNGIWLESFLLGENVNAEGYRSMSPALSADGTLLYYSSNRPGGYGGMDIWATSLTTNDGTEVAKNLGQFVNTNGDETTPFFHEKSNSLYFSSNGHIGFGGLDVYSSEYEDEADQFGQAVNAGSPINSAMDDSYFVLDSKLEMGYVTSNRIPCVDCDTIYNVKVQCNKIFKVNKRPLKFAINGHVYDNETNEVIPNARIEFKDISYEWPHFEIKTDEKGYYEHDLVPELELFMRASMRDYFADKAIVMTKGELKSKVFTQDFCLDKIPATEITIEGIEYDFDKADLRPSSKLILDHLIEFLELNNDLTIEIRSHTDQRGNDNYNYKLSERRAKSVVDYLIEHGIPIERLKPSGYGETMPAEVLDKEGNVVSLTEKYIKSLPISAREEAHQRNRRTAFLVLNQD